MNDLESFEKARELQENIHNIIVEFLNENKKELQNHQMLAFISFAYSSLIALFCRSIQDHPKGYSHENIIDEITKVAKLHLNKIKNLKIN